jgi:hypothetical protein
MDMWHRLLERFVPLMDPDVSSLDLRAGVGGATGPVQTMPGSAADSLAPAGRTHTAYQGSISPLPT